MDEFKLISRNTCNTINLFSMYEIFNIGQISNDDKVDFSESIVYEDLRLKFHKLVITEIY